MPTTTKTAKKAPAKKTAKMFSDAEMEAMQATKKERKTGSRADGEADLMAAIGKLSGLDRSIAEGLHALVTQHAPSLSPKTWYGLPAWANAEGKAVCFLTPASKFKARYSTIGFSDLANIDDGNLWPTSFGITKLGDAEKKQLTALIKQAVS